jgi:hypothetical protein
MSWQPTAPESLLVASRVADRQLTWSTDFVQCVPLAGPPDVKRDLETYLLRSKRDLGARVSEWNLLNY